MADKKTETLEKTETTKKTETVKIKLPRAASHQEQQLFVGLNGVNYIIPRGKGEIEVPKAVAAEIERAERAENKYWKTASERSALAINRK